MYVLLICVHVCVPIYTCTYITKSMLQCRHISLFCSSTVAVAICLRWAACFIVAQQSSRVRYLGEEECQP